ncbi:MAG: transcriptional regulator [Liquorilactobacillus nagelii]|jgi:hypothetical protein|uniref:transcriptional regulator n=1 Tax=Liquorilactobacillus nagelii TaxID=82688 RepID=UPI002432B3F4|nr:transcriptional regulator [Liquorilactobacillus nagelii]MCI1632979.1 transcriptional regulator [Liquorilactobacillus nagelii]
MSLSTTLDKALRAKDLATTEFAKQVNYSKQIVSGYRTGYRPMSVSKAAEFQKTLKDYQFGNRAAAKFFGTVLERRTNDLSYPDDPFLMIGLCNDEQADREKLEAEFDRIIRTPYSKRTFEQNRFAERYVRESLEEVSAEMLRLIVNCKELRLDLFDLVKEENQKNEE